MTLALLLTAVTGAMATTVTWVTNDFFNTSPVTFTKDDVTVTTSNGARMSNYFYGNGVNTFTTTLGNFTKIEIVFMPESSPLTISGWDYEVIEAVQPDPEYMPNVWQYTSKLTWTGDAESVSIQGSVDFIKSITFTIAEPEPPVEVTTNAAEEGATFTEATFAMPAFDATAEYELVRDMSVQMTATMGDGTDGVRYRVKKNEQTGKYQPADMDIMQVLALVAVNDGIEQKALTLDQDYFCRIYKLDEQTQQPEADGVKLIDFDFAPGLYALKAFAKDGSNYDGETALSNTFELFQGYEIDVPAGEYVTFYKDEALYVEDEDAKLYTITTVGNETATATELTVAAANTPLLVKNNAAEAKTILLIPTTTATPDDVTPYEGFKGTLEATQIAASTATQNNYAFNGKQFVWVKDALAIAANKCWLEIPNSANAAPAMTIVFGEATGIGVIDNGQRTSGDWYDLNGRKLEGRPTKKGVYINNGRKVVIK